MRPGNSPVWGTEKQRLAALFRDCSCRTITLFGSLLLVLYVSTFNYWHCQKVHSGLHLPIELNWRVPRPSSDGSSTPTNLSHVVFGIVGSLATWESRKAYVESWWRPEITRGYLFLDGMPNDESLLCPNTCPPVLINENITGWDIYPQIKHPYFYLGGTSETVLSNAYFTFEMGFGGAGFALSYPLAAAMAKTLDGCIRRYPENPSADYLTYTCILDLGVAVSHQKGFHQIDLRGDLSGFLSSHSQSPILTLHHINLVDPIFPSMDRPESIRHLMKPASFDQSRLVQQTICYHKAKNWTVSVSWGYSAHIYESLIPRFVLRKPIETFLAWRDWAKWPKFMFITRPVETDNKSCESPHWFFLEKVERYNEDEVVTYYGRKEERRHDPCSAGGNHSADHISWIMVISPAKARLEAERAECCDVISVEEKNTTTVRIRPCIGAEEIV